MPGSSSCARTLIPRELSYQLNPPSRFFSNLLRFLFARRGPQAKSSENRVGLRYARAFEKLGPAFIKLGQVLLTRGEDGDEIVCDLSHLKDQLPPFDGDGAASGRGGAGAGRGHFSRIRRGDRRG